MSGLPGISAQCVQFLKLSVLGSLPLNLQIVWSNRWLNILCSSTVQLNGLSAKRSAKKDFIQAMTVALHAAAHAQRQW
jgi:hypothetical protein